MVIGGSGRKSPTISHLTMHPSQVPQRPSKKHGIKGFMRNVFSSRVFLPPNSSAHDSPPLLSDHLHPTNISPSKDLLRKYTSSTPNSTFFPAGLGKRTDYTYFVSNTPRLSYSNASRFPYSHSPGSRKCYTVCVVSGCWYYRTRWVNRLHAARNVQWHPEEHFTTEALTPPPPDYGQSSTTKRSLSLLWHGFEQLLKRIEPCLDGTPAKVPVNVLNTIIDIGKVPLHLSLSAITNTMT